MKTYRLVFRSWLVAILAAMFLRLHRIVNDGKDHTYWLLVETVRTHDSPRPALLDHEPADVPQSRAAALLAMNRLCAPMSELGVEDRWYPTTALDDLPGFPSDAINETRLYRCLDRLLPHKTKLGPYLKERCGELFGAEFDVLLYELTSSYIEGQAEKNPLMQYGYSRDHRSDAKQVVIALIVNPKCFPLSQETFDGNRTDATTLEAAMRVVEGKDGRARRIWVFDRCIASEEDLGALLKRGGQYLVGTPHAKLEAVERELPEGGWTEVRDKVEAKLIPTPTGGETYVLCRSRARREIERAIRRRFSTRMERALKRLAQQIA